MKSKLSLNFFVIYFVHHNYMGICNAIKKNDYTIISSIRIIR